MKKYITLRFIFFIGLSLLTLNSFSQTNPNYDKKLADSLGSDAYGMKKYVLVILKSGENENLTKPERDSLFRGHMKNINELVNQGKLIVAGPLHKNEKNYRGIFILNVNTIDEAIPLLERDPAIKAKVFNTELFVWYGSAALPTYLQFHEKIEKDRH